MVIFTKKKKQEKKTRILPVTTVSSLKNICDSGGTSIDYRQQKRSLYLSKLKGYIISKYEFYLLHLKKLQKLHFILKRFYN